MKLTYDHQLYSNQAFYTGYSTTGLCGGKLAIGITYQNRLPLIGAERGTIGCLCPAEGHFKYFQPFSAGALGRPCISCITDLGETLHEMGVYGTLP